MKNENEKLDQMFKNHSNEWDIERLPSNHEKRFQKKLGQTTTRKKLYYSFAIAASIVLILGFALFYQTESKPQDFQFASKETKQTDSIFTVLIAKQLNELEEKKSPKNQIIIRDALKQMKELDNDYNKIIVELQKNGENKIIINALISNLQTRISFLQTVLQHIDANEKLTSLQDEKTL
ncbi:anti-sigma factor [Flavobacterium muglaense]|uniref:Anti-sigma factor n=1 Tax=Flavobacterium muglaense TaxID=2764716 RepID=A0A923N0A1_9FLAO|nr:anti-sigma factor [Flavobacterium muglaense]MBC5838302.1 anti-sigma factor [Flavobacterium muglaense]MBC5844837.1 anti-sigma factor [Flavobacterium muglaense]